MKWIQNPIMFFFLHLLLVSLIRFTGFSEFKWHFWCGLNGVLGFLNSIIRSIMKWSWCCVKCYFCHFFFLCLIFAKYTRWRNLRSTIEWKLFFHQWTVPVHRIYSFFSNWNIFLWSEPLLLIKISIWSVFEFQKKILTKLRLF